ncbi:uncharacterized protein LOC111375517 isoform X2 [Olea europaea var. sylvestris]|uniref:uncharacterized protein LOC111375517 isoform X2 n=1 Tax=Olea europaea var. sylvestris TaxID=158386 RepID=UPI000C1D688C|nr:uncharacterized protein LOC111375517 isoform X2 [Olea europaea var. sylvestris]
MCEEPAENHTSTSVFVNHAAISWHESRRKWIGDPTQRSKSVPKDPIISWSTTYEDLLSTNDPFAEPIPLPKKLSENEKGGSPRSISNALVDCEKNDITSANRQCLPWKTLFLTSKLLRLDGKKDCREG